MAKFIITKPYTAKSRPIIFNAEMVRAILDGRKTQTRRVIKAEWSRCLDLEEPDDLQKAVDQCPYGKIGDFLWVRETIIKRELGHNGRLIGATYAADLTPVTGRGDSGSYCGRATTVWKWKRDTLPSIFMPRWASRISLRIVEIGVERIQSITGLDIAKEGIAPEWIGKAKDFDQEKYGYLDLSAVSDDEVLHHYSDLWNKFMDLWDSINAKKGYGWQENPWVFVIEFERIKDE